MTGSDLERLYELLKQKDEHIAQLRSYAEQLEFLLQEKRADAAHDEAYQRARTEINDLRSQHGLRAGTLSLR